ncbi:Integral membrane protein [Madurella fahalii]|uniref:Integral membrane protein n=1 Tax=Madurella fahalii TaxID=1157608 RepID=A0ABQ0FYE3_9PEZI
MKANASQCILATALLSAGAVLGAVIGTCPNDGDVCFNIAVPTSSANAGSGNIYFQITAPTSFQWVALGTGQAMSGSNIFLVYQDGRGNLTLSPRLGTSYSMPRLDTSSTAARLTLLEGSGVSSDGTTMTANIACSNCQTWNGGEMSLTDTSAGWIGAWRAGPSLATTNTAANIAQHDGHAQFRVDMTRATIDSDSNPFLPGGGSGGGGGSGSGNGSSNGSGSGSGNGNGNGSGSGSGTGSGSTGGSGTGPSSNNGITQITASRATIVVAHGIIMALVMAVLYPLGSLLMPLLGKWWVHAAWQTIAFALMWAGFGLGVQTAQARGMLFNQTHTLFGTVIIALLGIQPLLGFLHHRHYLKTQSRGVISYAHIWWGRILMILGVVNGGSGLQLSRERSSLIIAYSVVAGVAFLSYFLFKGWAVFFRKNKTDSIAQKEANMPRRPYQESRRRRGTNV